MKVRLARKKFKELCRYPCKIIGYWTISKGLPQKELPPFEDLCSVQVQYENGSFGGIFRNYVSYRFLKFKHKNIK